MSLKILIFPGVALRKESVDRNDNGNAVAVSDLVALRKESVDRNAGVSTHRKTISVALRKESVDRNNIRTNYHIGVRKSLSARRAWIEIAVVGVLATLVTSLSARRAWIEMYYV